MSIIWALLESPDLAITEAAVGAGVTSILFFVTLKKIRAIESLDMDEYVKFNEEYHKMEKENEKKSDSVVTSGEETNE